MEVKQIFNDRKKAEITRRILEALPEWFGIPEAREAYIRDSAGKSFFFACDGVRAVGFLYLKETGRDTAELAVMGVLKEHHREGIGRELFSLAKDTARKQGYSFLQVKTVQMGKCEAYDRTNQFYRAVGFQEFEVIPTLWSEQNPCQIYVMKL